MHFSSRCSPRVPTHFPGQSHTCLATIRGGGRFVLTSSDATSQDDYNSTAMTKLGQPHISTTQDVEKLNVSYPWDASRLSIRRFCRRRCLSAIRGEYLWPWPRFYGKISPGSDSYVLTIWRGTPAKYDVENFAFNFGFSWQDLHKK